MRPVSRLQSSSFASFCIVWIALLAGCVSPVKNDSRLSFSSIRSTQLEVLDLEHPPRSFEQVIALPDEQFDVAEAVLALSAELDPVGSTDRSLGTIRELNRLAERARADLPRNPDGADYFDTLYEVVLNRKAAEPFRDNRAEDYDLSYTVQHHRGSCLSVGIMTLAVARRIGAPIWGAQCPAHFFLRHISEPDAKGKTSSLNFDVTKPSPENWKKIDDAFYRNWRRFDDHAESMGAYLRPLSDREVVSAFLSSRSGFHALKNNFELALKDARRALELNNRNVNAYLNIGYALESLGRLEEAERAYQKVLQIDPRCVRALNNWAFLKIRDPNSKLFDVRRSEKLIESALDFEPDKAYLHATHAEIKAVRRDWRGATRCMQETMRRDPKNNAYRERFLFFREKLRNETIKDY